MVTMQQVIAALGSEEDYDGEQYEIDRMGFVVILTMIPVLNTVDSIKYVFRK